MKKWTTALLVFMMIFSLAACGKENTENGEEVSADTTIEETTDNLTEEVVSNETDVVEPTTTPTETPTEAPTSEPTETPTETPTEVPVEQPTETPAPYTYTDLDQVMYAKQTVNVRSIPSADGEKLGSLSLNDEVHVTGQCNESGWYRIDYNGGIGYVSNNYLASEKVVESANNPENSTNTPPAVEPEPTTPVTPPSSGNGDNLSFSGSTTLPSGLTISTLNEFNNAGMDTSAGNSFMGDIYSDIVAQNYETMADNFDAYNSVWSHSAINVTNGEQIWWRSDLSNMSPCLELRRCGDHYKIIISSPCLDLATAESMGWSIGNSGDAPAREALTVLLSTISSTPQSLSDAIVSTLYTAPAGQEPIDTNGNWTSIGDCRIRLGAYDFENGNHMVVFRIAP